jgi:hypothetical protein
MHDHLEIKYSNASDTETCKKELWLPPTKLFVRFLPPLVRIDHTAKQKAECLD